MAHEQTLESFCLEQAQVLAAQLGRLAGAATTPAMVQAASNGLLAFMEQLATTGEPVNREEVAALLRSPAFHDLLARLLRGDALLGEFELWGFDPQALPWPQALGSASPAALLFTLLAEAVDAVVQPAEPAAPPQSRPEPAPVRSGKDGLGVDWEEPPGAPGGVLVKGGRNPVVDYGTGMPDFTIPVPKDASYWVIPVHYATDRAASTAAGEHFSGRRGSLSFGIAQVTIPRRHRVGRLEAPKWWKLEFSANPNRHVMLRKVTPMAEQNLLRSLRDRLGRSQRREVLVFVHGYKVTFNDAALRAAQLAHDLAFPGVTALYSWPSEGELEKYPVDEANVGWTVPHFQHFLTLLLAQSGAETVHVLAHSMGNRALVSALQTFDPATLSPGAARLRQVIFAAPDVDAGTFSQLADQFHGRAERFTLYASSEDLALKASRRWHGGYPRAGESGKHLTVVAGVDTIDATAVNTSFLGHSEYGDNRTILSDLWALLRDGKAPAERFALEERASPAGRYWWCRP